VVLHVPTPGNVFATRFTACIGDTILLTATQGRRYQWYRNDTLVSGAIGVVLNATVSGVYSAAIDDGTCAVRTTNSIKLQFDACLPDTKVFVPTAFTPNRNGTNDVLRPIFYHVTSLRYFKIYNRWGQQVFETSVLGKGWDGTLNGSPQPPETYSWVLECTAKTGELVNKSGRSLLIR
jgi:gliding motility-associated-like protein